MVGFLCSLWPWLLSGLLGWLLCGLLARRMLRGPDLSGQLADKESQLRRLTGEVSTLQARPPLQVEKLVEKIVEKPVDRVVEKFIDRPVDRVVEKVVEKYVDRPVDRIVERIVDRPVDRVVERVVDRPVEVVVEKVVDRPVDSPALLARVAALTAEVAVIAGLRHRVQQLEATPPKVVEKIVEKPVDRIVEKTVEVRVPDTAGIEERDRQLADWKLRYGQLERRLAEGPALDFAAAKAAGYGVRGADELEIIEGIGPKIADLLRQAGIRTFAQLADTPTARIQAILDSGGAQFRVANPGTWAEQADLAARNRWPALRALQDVLVAGVRVQDDKPTPAALAAQSRAAADTASQLGALQAQLAERDAEIKRLRQGPPLDLAAARAAGFSIKGEDDLEIVEGIGPKIAELLRAAGVTRFAELAAMAPVQIQPILDRAGPAFKLAKPDTWPEQADLAARNRWQSLKLLQDALNAGNRA